MGMASGATAVGRQERGVICSAVRVLGWPWLFLTGICVDAAAGAMDRFTMHFLRAFFVLFLALSVDLVFTCGGGYDLLCPAVFVISDKGRKESNDMQGGRIHSVVWTMNMI